MVSKKNIYKPISGILIIAFIGMLAIYFFNPLCPAVEEKQCPKLECPKPEKKALLEASVYDWAYNLLDPDELVFQYWIYNYGDLEGKDIKVKCELVENETEITFSFLDNYGNLASKTVEFAQFAAEKPTTFNLNKAYSGYCYIENCQDCEILYKRIPDLVESYK